MRRGLLALGLLAALGAAGFWLLTAPEPVPAAVLPDAPGDPERGRIVFAIGGCASCHAAKGAEGEDRLRLGGGRRFETAFGTFVAPNISPDPATGIGGWSTADLANAMLAGVSPAGEHYYPSFPYASYARMAPADIADLKALLDTLPPVARPNEPHALPFPFSIRRGIGLWKRLHLDPAPVLALPGAPPETLRGRYLVEGPGHCGECHTPRGLTGGLDRSRWMAGGPNPDGPGRIPNVTPGDGGIGGWSAAEIADYLETGFTPDYDTVGGAMVEVVRNTAQLPPADRAAIAAYLKALPPLAALPR